MPPNYMRRNVRKRTFGHVRLAKIQISLRICAVWLESSLGDAKFLHADIEDSLPSKMANLKRDTTPIKLM